MKKLNFFILSGLFLSFSLFPNFGGYEISKIDGAGGMLNVDKNNSIELIRERLYFDLGQRVKFKGEFSFLNTSSVDKELTFGFPIESFWEVLWDEKNGYYPNDSYNNIKVQIKIDGVLFKKVKEKLSLRTDNFKKIILLSRNEMKSKPLPYITTKAGELNAKPGLPILLWKLFNYKIPSKRSIRIEISFIIPWFFADEFWSDNLHTNGLRFFNYITSTASTWKGGKIKDFKAVVKFPEDAENRISIFPTPESWIKVGEGYYTLTKHNFSPSFDDHIHFLWISKYYLRIPSDILHFSPNETEDEKLKERMRKVGVICWNNRYYNDYSWRFLFDGSSKTTWSGKPEIINKAVYEIARLNDSFKREMYEDVLPFKQWYTDLKFVFIYPKVARKILIITGYTKNLKTFTNNSRPKKMLLILDKEIEQEIILKDSMKKQIFDLKIPTTSLKFKILSIYPGEEYDDVCISEIDLK